MRLDTDQAVQYMQRVSLEVEKHHGDIAIVAYLDALNYQDEKLQKAFEKTYFDIFTEQGQLQVPESAIELLHFARGYCFSLLEQGLNLNDRKLISDEGIDYLRRNNSDIFKIFEKHALSPQTSTQEHSLAEIVENILNTVASKINSKEVAYQFILEELEAASGGNEDAQNFVLRNQFLADEFDGSMSKSTYEVDGPNGPQQTLIRLLLSISFDLETMVSVRIDIDQKIIDFWFPNNKNTDKIDWDDVF